MPLALIDGAGGVQRDLANCNGDGTVDVALETAKDEPLTPIVERRLVLFEGTIRIERGGATDTVAIRQVIRKIFVPATRTATALGRTVRVIATSIDGETAIAETTLGEPRK